MSEIFGSTYATNYDAFYQEKDYHAECDLLEDIFSKYGSKPVKSILDLGCGTGNYAIPLAQRGYRVTGVDRSPEMLSLAQTKLGQPELSQKVKLYQGHIETFQLEDRFDTAILMFAVLGYQLENAQVLRTLCNAKHHLNRGGLLIFEIWYGPAVLSQRPSERLKIIRSDERQLIRWSAGTLDIRHHTCRVDYHIWELSQGVPVKEIEEIHQMRFFFSLELELLLESSGFHLMRLGSFPEIDCEPDETTWNVIAVAIGKDD